ncbi:unnamed protein product [Gulo gulo]|uniref:Uncharacterized protein n=1 Tax=Gulo gulo TaxID=48420 RepID=A0A9X9M4Z5_GULGU|nr:unnamed protein product [Gulo gulo]
MKLQKKFLKCRQYTTAKCPAHLVYPWPKGFGLLPMRLRPSQ